MLGDAKGAGLRFVGLRMKLAVLFVIIAAVLLALYMTWNTSVQQEQAEREMLESTRMLVAEMDAVWDFMERNQTQFIRNENGTYNLYCVVAAKAVASIFTKNNDGFVVHYTNLSTRKPDDSPDDFERLALEELQTNPDLGAYYALTEDASGAVVFRYIEPLYIQESCLDCHGEPAGEIDEMGYPKEGKKVGDLAGAASIIMPASTYMDGIRESTLSETLVFSLFVVCGLGVIFWSISRMVTSPVRRLELAAKEIEQHKFDIDLRGVGQRDEIGDLAVSFTEMARQLKSLYEGLEAEVDLRTAQIRESNEILEEQRGRLESMNLMLQKDNQLKSDFLAMVSHEIRTPLTSILAFVDIWERTSAPRNANEEKIMNEMRASSQILLSMVNNILGMARAEAGKLELSLEPLDVADLLYDIKGNLSFLANKKGLLLDVSLQRDIPVLVSDAEKLRRILENLISNAIKYTPEGGSISVRVTYGFLGGCLVLAVCDDGCGIKEEDTPFIFDRFARGSENADRGGSGLGLALVKEYVGLLGGEIRVESALGVGSSFTVCIPAEAVDEEGSFEGQESGGGDETSEGGVNEDSAG